MMTRVVCSQYPVASRKHRTARFGVLLTTGYCLLTTFPAFAQPTQTEVLRSISEGIDNQGGDPTRVLALFTAALGLTLLLLVLSYRRKREVAPKPLNHPAKLIREISRSIHLKPAELKQLKLLAEQQSLGSPLTLLLCPSLLSRGIKDCGGKLDRTTLSGIARKIANRE